VAQVLADVAARGQGEPLPLQVPDGSRASLWNPDPDATVPVEPAAPGGGPAARPGRGLLARGAGVALALAAAGVLLLAEGTWLRARLASPEERARFAAIEAARGRLAEDPAALVDAIEAYRRDFEQAGWLRQEVQRLRATPLPFRERAWLVPVDGPGAAMIFVPGGSYAIGRAGSAGEEHSRPRTVHLAGFLIDRDEVSNRRYEQFLAEWRAAGGVHRCGDPTADHARPLVNRPLADRALSPDPEGPVVGTTPWDAREMALFLGRRLPSEDEWEVAASWDPDARSARAYPWGPRAPNGSDQRYFANLSFAEWGTWLAEEQRFLPQCAPGRSFEFDRSPLGLFDCAGNAAEWCQGSLPLPGRQPLRGGSLRTSDPAQALLTARRELDPAQPPPPEAGFRTVLPFER
jgi:formylglycine-generating enzyme required for sulfatase activity